MTGLRRSLATAAISFLLCGCGQSHQQLSGGYYLERFDEGGTSYYVGSSGKPVNGGGVFDGTVQEIGWNEDWILARVNRLYHGDTNGWYVLNVKTGQVLGPFQASEVKANSAFSNIKIVQPSILFGGD
jgi:hypothetical protein